MEGEGVEKADLRFTVIIPSYNSAQRLDETLQSLIRQNYSNLEVIIVDASSSDRTADVVQAAHELRPRLYSVPSFSRYEMYNRAISLATGDYFSILLPGDLYVSQKTLSQMARLIVEEGSPPLAYCGCFLREANVKPRTLYRPLTLSLLKNGQQPTSLQACWFRVDQVRQLGRFQTRYRMRASFDLLCRMAAAPEFRSCSLYRVYLDHERSMISHQELIRRSWETTLILGRHFGWWWACLWFIAQNPFKLVAWTWKGLRYSVQ